MKKVITAILTAAALANCIPVFSGEIIADTMTTSSYTNESGDTVYTTEDGFEYTIANDEITITKYTGNAIDLTIPDYIDGLPVTTLGNKKNFVFVNKTNLQTVTLNDNMLTLNYTFFNCDSLKKVNLNNGLVRINNQCFYNCNSLEEITIPNTIQYCSMGMLYHSTIKK